jgi:hypothetical protein
LIRCLEGALSAVFRFSSGQTRSQTVRSNHPCGLDGGLCLAGPPDTGSAPLYAGAGMMQRLGSAPFMVGHPAFLPGGE